MKNQSLNKSKSIINNFIYENFRAPSYREFIKCGGAMGRDRFYDLRKSMGFVNDYGTKVTYEVLDSSGEVLFTGTSREIAEEYGTTTRNVVIVCRLNQRFRRKYILRKKVV